jgi:hypothetical protein
VCVAFKKAALLAQQISPPLKSTSAEPQKENYHIKRMILQGGKLSSVFDRLSPIWLTVDLVLALKS